MTISRVFSILILSPALLLAQLNGNTVTVTATQNSAVQPDQAVFSLTVSAATNKSLEDVVGALASQGITAANLVSVVLPQDNAGTDPGFDTVEISPPTFRWTFQLTVPFSRLKETSAALVALQQTISQSNSGFSLSFALSGTQTAWQPVCNYAGLIAQARTQAQQAAAAAGFNAGAIAGLSTGGAACSLTVRFALGLMFAQPLPNTISVSSSRASTAQPDQVSIYLYVTSAGNASLDDVTGALAGAGITGASFTGLYQTAPAKLNWSFTLTAPLAKLTATLGQVLTAQQAIMTKNAGMTLTLGSAYVSASASQQSSACPQAALVADAQAEAQKVAAAAGVSVGPILSISEGGLAVPIVATRSGLFSAVLSGSGYASFQLSSALVTSPLACSLTVQYQLL